MKKLILLFILLFTIIILHAKNPIIVIKTSLGSIEVEIYEKKAPITAKNFLKYVDKGSFTRSHFYRVVTDKNQADNPSKIQVIQGGLWYKPGANAENLPGIKHETTKETGVLHKAGTISMARAELGTAAAEFFICVEDEPELDYGGKRNDDLAGFAAFGKVIKGMDVVKKIHQQYEENEYLIPKIRIHSIIRK